MTEAIDKSNDHGIDPGDEERFVDGPDIDQPALDDLLGAFSRAIGGDETGWGAIDSAPAALAEQRRQSQAAMKRKANDFRDCFSTPAGRRVLEQLLDQTLRAEAYPEEAQLPMEAITPLCIAHQTRCNFVRAILAAIAQADNRPQSPQAQDA
ncbi:hypothetical protein [Oricola cellulosilytica]|uniref:Uncharacterized protein n=1 Tax=Oricola cellulosilytica TaxID=1429082 RepID=A0A4R0PCF9_9HYPH|nr:hypothetical protein [Oricola cellulosilytica]TCD15150.1 hypothetical protein E0D97_06270 [Oricola cellulosilytica]